MREVCKKIAKVLKTIFGFGIMLALFTGGAIGIGYIVAVIIGGDVAAAICNVIYNNIVPVMIYGSVIMVLLGLVAMYLDGETALTPEKKHAHKHEGEM